MLQDELNISGHRIIDVHHFYKELIRISNHDSMFECGLGTMAMTSENRIGLTSIFSITCLLCKSMFKIKNTMEPLNKMAVEGSISAGCGRAELDRIAAAMDLPVMSYHTYQQAQDIVFDEWEVTAWEEMRKAGEMEKEAALKEGRVTKDGTPIIDVLLDGCWCKRSYRTNYSALSGAAVIIGRRFGQVLFMAVKNKYCCICARAEKVNETPRKHECFRNYSGSSTGMESTIIAEGFKQSVDMHGLVYGRFIADGDSSTYAKILETRPYPSVTVEKLGCKNHILRNFSNKMVNVKTDTKYDIKDRKIITNGKMMSARKYICDAIQHHGSQDSPEPKSESIKKLHHDVMVSIYHGFGCHNECNKHICSLQTTTDLKEFFKSFLWHRVRSIVGDVASQARSLIENVDSNIVENFNGVIAKFVGGKRVNYALKRAYQSRCAGAVISFNSGKILTTVHQNINGKNPLDAIDKYEKKVVKQREYNQTLTRRKNRKLGGKTDFDYGENVTKPDMDLETFELAKKGFLANIRRSKEERHDIEQRTILQSDSGEWLELRRNLLTASNFGKVVKRIKTKSCAKMVKNMLYKPNIDHVASIKHGKRHEKLALAQLEDMMNLKISKCGLFIDEKYNFLGATPDGISDEIVIEVKCPIAPYNIGINAAIQEGKMHFWRVNKKTGCVEVNKKSDWFFQAQGQLHICQKETCVLAAWYGNNLIKTEIIQKDDQFWHEKMEPHLLSFYNDCLLPELVDPRCTRNLQIRDPKYVKQQDKENQCSETPARNNDAETNLQPKTGVVDAVDDSEDHVIDFEFF